MLQYYETSQGNFIPQQMFPQQDFAFAQQPQLQTQYQYIPLQPQTNAMEVQPEPVSTTYQEPVPATNNYNEQVLYKRKHIKSNTLKI